MTIDPRFKPWAIHTGKLAAIGAVGTAVGIINQEIVLSFFANTPYGIAAAAAASFIAGLIAKSPYFKGEKKQ